MAHLSPDTPAVDVAVTPLDRSAGSVTLPQLRYGGISGYQRLPAGRYAVSVRAAGSPSTTPPVLTVAVEVAAGEARTVVVGSRFADLELAALTDDLGPPPPGSARVRVLDAAASSPTVDLAVADGPSLAAGQRFPGAGSEVTVPAGSRTLRLTAGGTTTELPFDVPAGAVLTLLVLDAPGGGVTVRPVVAAAGPAAAPVGPVDAGGGGTAPADSSGAELALLSGTLLAAGIVAGRRRLRPVALACAVGAAGLAAWSPAPPPARSPSAVPVAPAARIVPIASGAPAAPVRVVAPAVGIDAPLLPVTADSSGALAAPDAPGAAGWLATGPAPGAIGPAVVAGHVDSRQGPAVFFRLRQLAPGDPVLVLRGDGSTARFVVERVARYAKSRFPTAEVYGPTPDAELRLITCGGAFDRAARSYTDDVVVFARATG